MSDSADFYTRWMGHHLTMVDASRSLRKFWGYFTPFRNEAHDEIAMFKNGRDMLDQIEAESKRPLPYGPGDAQRLLLFQDFSCPYCALIP